MADEKEVFDKENVAGDDAQQDTQNISSEASQEDVSATGEKISKKRDRGDTPTKTPLWLKKLGKVGGLIFAPFKLLYNLLLRIIYGKEMSARLQEWAAAEAKMEESERAKEKAAARFDKTMERALEEAKEGRGPAAKAWKDAGDNAIVSVKCTVPDSAENKAMTLKIIATDKTGKKHEILASKNGLHGTELVPAAVYQQVLALWKAARIDKIDEKELEKRTDGEKSDEKGKDDSDALDKDVQVKVKCLEDREYDVTYNVAKGIGTITIDDQTFNIRVIGAGKVCLEIPRELEGDKLDADGKYPSVVREKIGVKALEEIAGLFKGNEEFDGGCVGNLFDDMATCHTKDVDSMSFVYFGNMKELCTGSTITVFPGVAQKTFAIGGSDTMMKPNPLGTPDSLTKELGAATVFSSMTTFMKNAGYFDRVEKGDNDLICMPTSKPTCDLYLKGDILVRSVGDCVFFTNETGERAICANPFIASKIVSSYPDNFPGHGKKPADLDIDTIVGAIENHGNGVRGTCAAFCRPEWLKRAPGIQLTITGNEVKFSFVSNVHREYTLQPTDDCREKLTEWYEAFKEEVGKNYEKFRDEHPEIFGDEPQVETSDASADRDDDKVSDEQVPGDDETLGVEK